MVDPSPPGAQTARAVPFLARTRGGCSFEQARVGCFCQRRRGCGPPWRLAARSAAPYRANHPCTSRPSRSLGITPLHLAAHRAAHSGEHPVGPAQC